MNASFRYGLIKPQKPSTRLLAFASDSDSDDESNKKKIPIGESITQKRQARVIQEDALKEDPTIFQYDEVYDDISANREEAKKAKSTEPRQAKYINRLLVAAEKRKVEYETRVERKVQKEREAEGDKYKDKEVFVTAAYREKLEALKKAAEEAQREEYLENIGDVRKQKDLSGFYRHMYEQKLGADKNAETKPIEADSSTTEIKKIDEKSSKKRKYRKHSEHEKSDDDENEQSTSKQDGEPAKKVHLQSNLDADSDFSIDSESESDGDEKEIKKEGNDDSSQKKEAAKKANEIAPQPGSVKIEEVKVKAEENGASNKENESTDANGTTKTDSEQMPPPPKEVKPKIDVWKKRTVGDVYLAAVKRYFERKAAA